VRLKLQVISILSLTVIFQLILQWRLPGNGEQAVVTSLAFVAVRSGLCVSYGVYCGNYLGMWRRVSGATVPWRLAAVLAIPLLYVGALTSYNMTLIDRSLTLAALGLWVVIACSVKQIGAWLDDHYAAKRSPLVTLQNNLFGLPAVVRSRTDMIGLDIALVLLTVLLWVAMKMYLKLR
jgi:hypothetical protein